MGWMEGDEVFEEIMLRLAALRGMLSVDSNSGSAFRRDSRLKKICGICGKLKFRLGLPCDPSNFRIV
jgi:hypothetical protein